MVVSDTSTIGDLIRSTRKAQGLTQPDLALIANVGVRFIVDLESGKETCQLGLSLRVMQALGIELDINPPGHDPAAENALTVDLEETEGPTP